MTCSMYQAGRGGAQRQGGSGGVGWRFWGRCVLALSAVLLAAGVSAQPKAGAVSHLQGMATAQQPNGSYRFLARGDAVLEGDVISTTERGYAVVSLDDGTKFTLRPSSTFALDRFQQEQGQESALMRLLRGGVRMVTGFVSKRNPAGFEFKVKTATLGIRGTSFDARICGDDCRQEGMEPKVPGAALAGQLDAGPVVARLVRANGTITATRPGHAPRNLSLGAALYQGDDVRTGPDGIAVIGFRDQTRASVNPNTVIRIDAYVYDQPQASDSFAVSLLKGGLRLFTGLIGKKEPRSFSVRTLTATIGIRGTGIDISCEGPCVDPSLGETATGTNTVDPARGDGLFMLTWEGTSYFQVGPLDVALDQVGFIGNDGLGRILRATPDFLPLAPAPRPDQVEVDWDRLFASVAPTGADGIYVYVRDGHVFLTSGDSRVDMGVGEAGFVGANGRAVRMSPVPGFLTADPYPLPELFSQTDRPVFQLFGITLGKPGQEICRL
jgi:hypothetical protein